MYRKIMTATAVISLSGCVVPTGPVEVTRFNKVADGQAYGQGSYNVQLADADSEDDNADAGSLALSPYSAAVRREMNQLGYSEANENADYTASVRVRVNGRVKQGSSPVSVGVGGGTGGRRSGVGLGVGINLGGGRKERTVTQLSVRIADNKTQDVIWEGKAVQEAGKGTPAAQPGIAASKLAAALFAGFPGQNGETIEVK